MTLLVYKNGVLAANNGATRNGSRERFTKITTFTVGKHAYALAAAGEVDSIVAYREWMNIVRDEREHPPELNCSGIIVRTDGNTGDRTVYTFNCFPHARGRGVWVPEDADSTVIDGADHAVSMALAVDHVRPELEAGAIIRLVSEINVDADCRFGVTLYNTATGAWCVDEE